MNNKNAEKNDLSVLVISLITQAGIFPFPERQVGGGERHCSCTNPLFF
ncbi:hypothetical protein HMPREF3039_03168 [Akkermansia sp. KLE1798]|nr:hypothetical protein HMPREF3039_03168 [Akkermansia sp. KLE1798]KZA04073.1 hypothetical protein HMPREF1326_02271 [Akkermansia sp. KLE1605]